MKQLKNDQRTVVIKFTGKSVDDELYQVTLKGIDEIMKGISDTRKLSEIRLSLLNSLAIVENKLAHMYQIEHSGGY